MMPEARNTVTISCPTPFLLRRIHARATTIRRKRCLIKLGKIRPVRIIIGAARQSQRGWLATDSNILSLLKPSDWQEFFEEGSIRAILAEHVWEHLTLDEGSKAAELCYRYLEPGGYLRIAVPDGLNPNPRYIEYVRPAGTGSGAADHRVLYTYQTLTRLFESARFRVEMLEFFDESGNFHALPWKPEEGIIRRSKRFESRSWYSSLIADFHKDC